MRTITNRRRRQWHEALSLRFRNRVTELAGRVDPQMHGFLGLSQRGFVSFAVCHAAGKFRNLGDEKLILAAPVKDDLVLVNHQAYINPFRVGMIYLPSQGAFP